MPTIDDARTALRDLYGQELDEESAAALLAVYAAYVAAHQTTIARGRPWTLDEWLRQLVQPTKGTTP